MKRSHRRRMLTAVLLVAGLALAACGGDDETSDDNSGAGASGDPSSGSAEGTGGGAPSSAPSTGGGSGTAVVAGSGEVPADVDPDGVLSALAFVPLHVDPVRGINICDIAQLSLIYDFLIRTTPDGTFIPGLAASWDAPDPSTFTMTLQPDVVFQDGTPFDAAAVKAHIERGQTDPESTLTRDLAAIESIETPDDLTVVLHLNAPVAGTMAPLFSGRAGEVPSPTAVEEIGSSDYGSTAAIGAGPYRYVSHAPDESMVLERWDGYWDPASQLLQGVELTGNVTQFMVDRLVQGQNNFVNLKDVDYAPAKTAESNGDLVVHVSPSSQFGHIMVNYAEPPFDQLEVRQALQYALDRETLTSVVTSDLGEMANGIFPADHWAHNPDVDDLYPYDPEKAKELLADAGYPDGVEVEVGYIIHPYYEKFAQAVQDMVEESGFHFTLRGIEGAQINQELYVRKSAPVAITAYNGNPDPGQTLASKYAAGGNANPSGKSVPGIDELLAEGAAAVDQDERAAAYQKAEKLVMEYSAEFPVYFQAGITAHTPEVKNVDQGYTTCAVGNFFSPPPYIAKD